MATVVVTFFLFIRITVCKMDADFKEKRRERISSQREKRWSMNSQRLEEIVAELMRPIGDLRHNFDTDLSALLEEYLTEAGLHALDAEEGSSSGSGTGELVPNFAELALLLQQSASIYGRKVDFLYQHVLSVSDSLQNSTLEISNSSSSEPSEAATPSRRRRKASVHSDFTHIELEACAGARREAGAPRPPPTLPRVYLELEPRVVHDHDQPLQDYAGEPIGLLTDFHVSWRLQSGQLVEELELEAGGQVPAAAQLRAIPLLELQAAIAAAAPPDPPPLSPPPACSTPLPPFCPSPAPLAPDMPPPPAPTRRERKRKNDCSIDDILGGRIKLVISKELRKTLSTVQEFSIPAVWVSATVRSRCNEILTLRRRLANELDEFRGFDFSTPDDSGGFLGWSVVEATQATVLARDSLRLSTRLHSDSEDDGFFEQSSLADSDGSTVHDSLLASGAEWMSWRAGVVRRAAEEEARGGVDVTALAQTVLRALPPPPASRACDELLVRTTRAHTDVSRMLLATLFLANAGNVEIIQGEPLSLNSFSVQLVTDDSSLYCAVADADELFR